MSRKLLIADDEASLRALVGATLESQAYQCLEATNGIEALRMAQVERPDVVVLDLGMPGLNGVEVCRGIKGTQGLEETFVIMLTGSEDPQDRDRALAAGANTYFTKPFSPLQLLKEVQQVMNPAVHEPERPSVLGTAPPSRSLAAFMFVDIRDFTGFSLRHGDEAALALIQTFQGLVKLQVNAHGGRLVNTAGDNILVTFPTAHQAVCAGFALVRGVAEYGEANPGKGFEVGAGLDVGEPMASGNDFIGTVLNRTARVTAAALPGQVLATETVYQLAGQPPGLALAPVTPAALKGFPGETHLYEVIPAGRVRPAPKRRSHPGRYKKARWAAVVIACLTVLAVAVYAVGQLPRPGSDGEQRISRQPGMSLSEVVATSRPFTVLISSRARAGAALGSGVIYDSRGLIVTNAHVIEGAERVEVHLGGGVALTGTVRGVLTDSDLAVIEVGGGPYQAAVLGDSSKVQEGEQVLVLGYPTAFTLGAQATPTQGIVSQTSAGLDGRYIQVDAPMNPGVSGGPLLNRDGEVIGINVGRLEVVGGRNVEGIGFAIPVNRVRELLPRLEAGEVKPVSAQAGGKELLSPAQVVASFHRLIHAGEFGLGYALASAGMKSSLSVAAFAQQYGYAGTMGVSVQGATVLSETETAAEVRATTSVSVLEGGQVISTWYEQRWRLVREGQEWKVDALLSSTKMGG